MDSSSISLSSLSSSMRLPPAILHLHLTMKVCRRIVRSFKSLKWLLSVRRACASAYAKFNPNPSCCRRRCNASDDREAVGVMKLGDVVSECKYSDVHVMWSILKETHKHHQQAAAIN